MNWMQKISSVTFMLDGSLRISQPKDIMALSYVLEKFAGEKVGFYVGFNTVTPDGDDFGNMTGTINWYVTDKISEEQQQQIMQEWVQEMELMDYVIKVIGPEISGLSMPGDPPLMVYRLHVLKNGSEDHMKIPEINLANGNAEALMNSLGIPFDWSGSINLNELQTKLEMFTPWDQQGLTEEPSQGGGEGQARWYDGGRSEDQVQRYVDALSEIVNFGLNNGFETLVWG